MISALHASKHPSGGKTAKARQNRTIRKFTNVRTCHGNGTAAAKWNSLDHGRSALGAPCTYRSLPRIPYIATATTAASTQAGDARFARVCGIVRTAEPGAAGSSQLWVAAGAAAKAGRARLARAGGGVVPAVVEVFDEAGARQQLVRFLGAPARQGVEVGGRGVEVRGGQEEWGRGRSRDRDEGQRGGTRASSSSASSGPLQERGWRRWAKGGQRQKR